MTCEILIVFSNESRVETEPTKIRNWRNSRQSKWTSFKSKTSYRPARDQTSLPSLARNSRHARAWMPRWKRSQQSWCVAASTMTTKKLSWKVVKTEPCQRKTLACLGVNGQSFPTISRTRSKTMCASIRLRVSHSLQRWNTTLMGCRWTRQPSNPCALQASSPLARMLRSP